MLIDLDLDSMCYFYLRRLLTFAYAYSLPIRYLKTLKLNTANQIVLFGGNCFRSNNKIYTTKNKGSLLLLEVQIEIESSCLQKF